MVISGFRFRFPCFVLLLFLVHLGGRALAWNGAPRLSLTSAKVTTRESRGTLDEKLAEVKTALKENRLAEAVEKCQQALAENPKSDEAYYLLGMIQRRRGKLQEARQAFLQALKSNPANIESHLALGRLHLETNNLGEAEKEFQEAVRLGDSRGKGRYGLALTLIGQTKYREALPALIGAAEADPKDPERLFTLCVTELQLEQVREARKHLNRLERLSSNDPTILFRIGKLRLDHKMPREAEVDFERAAALVAAGNGTASPEIKLPYLYLQIAQLRFNRFDYLGTISSLGKIEPGSVEPDLQAAALDLLGAAHLAIGNAREARAKQSQAAQLDPNEPIYVSHLAWTELLAGDAKASAESVEFAKSKWPENPDVKETVAFLRREELPERKRVPFSRRWHLKGVGLICCPCTTPCPCRSNAPPTHGHCESGGAFHVAQGHYGDVTLDGLTFVVVHGAMGPQATPTAMFVDSSATTQQMVALEHILQQFSPVRPLLFLNVKRAKILFVRSEGGRVLEVEIPGLLKFKIQRQLNSRGEPILRTAALDYFSNIIEYARNLTYRVQDQELGLKWDYSGRQANYRTFDLDSSDYENALMLIQFADGSGHFNERQQELIRDLKLPTSPSYPGLKQ